MSAYPDLKRALVFHPGGALGDFVLMWPMLRTLLAGGTEVEVISAGSKARLAQRVLGVRGTDSERPEWTAMWRGPADGAPASRENVGLVVGAGVNAAWIDSARQRFPSAELVTPQGWLDRQDALFLQSRVGSPVPVPRFAEAVNPAEVVCHVGAGGGEKSWELARWIEVHRRLDEQGVRVRLVAGEVEGDRWTRERLGTFEQSGGRLLGSLDELVDVIAPAAVFVGADTGPTHLSAQLAVPTLALFGPTDPAAWAPIGPRVRVLAPPAPGAMTWLTPQVVLDAILGMLQEATAFVSPGPARRQ